MSTKRRTSHYWSRLGKVVACSDAHHTPLVIVCATLYICTDKIII